MRRFATCLAGLAAGLAGCAEPAPPPGLPVAATLAPATARGSLPEPDRRYPQGSRITLLDLELPGEAPLELTEGMAAAGGTSVSIDGNRLAFVGRLKEDDGFAVWTSDKDGGDRRQLAGAPAGAGGIAWLPDGRLAVAAPVEGPPPLDGMSSAWALFVVSPEEEAAERITFGASELDPAVLADGRIVYSQWLPGGDGRPEGGGFALFTVHPDGTGAAPLHGYHGGPRLKLLPRQTHVGDVVFLGGEPDGVLTLETVDWGRPEEPSTAAELPSLGAMAAEPGASGTLLVAASESSGASGLWLLKHPEGGVGATLEAPENSRIVHAVEVTARARPQGHLSMVDPEADEGQLLCIDARPPGALDAHRVRLSSAESDGSRRVLGEVPLADDGSFFTVVPVDQPLYLDLLAADGSVLVATETPIWVRPREVRACVGCHERPTTAPPNRRPLAVIEEPIDLTEPKES
jgi:hypothetical protein